MVAEPSLQLSGSETLRDATGRVESTVAGWFATFLLWQERGRQRRALARLEDALLRDIGRSREEAMRESAKPAWRA